MIVGVVRDALPRIRLTLAGSSEPIVVEFVVDTGFEGEISLPFSLIHRVNAQPLYHSHRSLADGTIREYPVFELTLDWLDSTRVVHVLTLENRPLIGTDLLDRCQVYIDFTEGGEVSIERTS